LTTNGARLATVRQKIFAASPLARRASRIFLVLRTPDRAKAQALWTQIFPFCHHPNKIAFIMELPNARTIFPEVWQRANEWCIPAGLEVLLHYFGISHPTQEEMVLRFDDMYGAHGYVLNGNLIKFNSKPTIEDLKHCGFPNPGGNFDGFTAVANSLLAANCDRVFYHPRNCDADFEKHLLQTIQNGDGVLGVIRWPNGNCHVLPIIGFDGTHLTSYDPGARTIETKQLGQYTFNRDCVILKKRDS
jgi:hypothetical protein